MAKDINKEVFPEETLLKLKIFTECFREWFPVFIHNPFTKGVYIVDFFAGSGMDSKGNLGSPLLLLNEARGTDNKYCNAVSENAQKVFFAFNENNKQKETELEINIKTFMDQCIRHNCNRTKCVYSYLNFGQYDFKEVFYRGSMFTKVLTESDYAKFILLDQYGFSQVDEDVFLKLVDSPYTDFIFFISSSFIKRFKTLDYTKRYIDTDRIHFDEANPKECHRLIADYYQNLIPKGKEYYIHHFSIKKGVNYWGLIFGTNHTLGMEKFLRVCWDKNPDSGDANFNINDDFQEGDLFYSEENTNKKEEVKAKIIQNIFNGIIKDNKTGLKFALKERCLPKLFTDIVQELNKDGIIRCFPKLNRQSTNIHKVDLYQIEVVTR
ncbi:MAG: three-Cys-motif partner protein TcmP [Tannerella sp.]|jgi:three-Cys-motif partner protein|nr:three-Cys-motif partner protein TcmP [Tannerella sp.]